MEPLIAYVFAAGALLGSPGPGITALIAVGRGRRPAEALMYFGSMQMGLAIAAAISAAGLISILHAVPFLHLVLNIASIAYLTWLAWQIASAPLTGGVGGSVGGASFTLGGGFLLGIANPKAYLAFASLFGSFTLLDPEFGLADTALKWGVCVAVMVLVDLAWVVAGMALGRINLSARAERAMNIAMGAAILLACVATLL